MGKPKIGIIIGSVREKRNTETVAQYIFDIAKTREGDFEYELVDLAKFNVPIFSSPNHPAMSKKKYDDPNVQAWSDAVDSCDGFVFVTPEYNHGVPGAFKNAVDSLGPEWTGKPVAFAGHGAVGGVRAIEQWRPIISNFSMPNLRAELNFNLFLDWQDGTFVPSDRREKEVNLVLSGLEDLVITAIH